MCKDACRDFIQSSAAATVKPKQAQLRLIAWLHERTKGWTTGSRRHENRDMKRVDGRGQGHLISFNAPCTGLEGACRVEHGRASTVGWGFLAFRFANAVRSF